MPCLAISPFVKRNHTVLRPRHVDKQAPRPTCVVSYVGSCDVSRQFRLSSPQEAPHPTEMRVVEALYLGRRRPPSSPCDRINCFLDDGSPLSFAMIVFHFGESWAVGRSPEQFLRRTELIKRSLWTDDELAWWCLEPRQRAAL